MSEIARNEPSIFIDDAAQVVRVTVPAGCKPERAFIRACHETAGNLGYGIQFVAG